MVRRFTVKLDDGWHLVLARREEGTVYQLKPIKGWRLAWWRFWTTVEATWWGFSTIRV